MFKSKTTNGVKANAATEAAKISEDSGKFYIDDLMGDIVGVIDNYCSNVEETAGDDYYDRSLLINVGDYDMTCNLSFNELGGLSNYDLYCGDLVMDRESFEEVKSFVETYEQINDYLNNLIEYNN